MWVQGHAAWKETRWDLNPDWSPVSMNVQEVLLKTVKKDVKSITFMTKGIAS